MCHILSPRHFAKVVALASNSNLVSSDTRCMRVQAVYGREHDMSELHRALKMGDWGELVQLKGFQEQLKAGFPAFDMLRTIAASN